METRRFTVQQLKDRAALRAKMSGPHNESTPNEKTFVVNVAKPSQQYLRNYRIDRLVLSLLDKKIFDAAQPTLNFGQFEVSADAQGWFRELAAANGLEVQEVRL